MIICGESAFRYYRTPPQILALYPELRKPRNRYDSFSAQPLSSDVFGGCVHTLVFDQASRTCSRSTVQHLWSGELPMGHIRETPHGARIVSPELALFQMASSLSVVNLAMSMYEACGWFSVCRIPRRLGEREVSNAEQSLPFGMPWRRTRSSEGKPSDLWQRPPLVDFADLVSFESSVRGRRGSVRFSRALSMVTGCVASPFEAQVSLLLSLPRKCGGEGLSCFENNAEIRMSRSAQLTSGLAKCYVDLLFPSRENGRSVALECQGRVAHGLGGFSFGDANRMLALETMGIDVIPITYEQIANPERFRTVVRLISEKTGQRRLPKTEFLLKSERKLRAEIFIDWADLGLGRNPGR